MKINDQRVPVGMNESAHEQYFLVPKQVEGFIDLLTPQQKALLPSINTLKKVAQTQKEATFDQLVCTLNLTPLQMRAVMESIAGKDGINTVLLPKHAQIHELPDGIAHKDGLLGPSSPDSWCKPGFDVMETLRTLPGPLLEVGGPSRDYALVDFSKLDRKLHISNILPGLARIHPKKKRLDLYGSLDFMVDATDLPFEQKSIGALFASALPRVIRKAVLLQALEALEPGGLLVWKSVVRQDLFIARRFGLETVQYVCDGGKERGWHAMHWTIVWQKPLI